MKNSLKDTNILHLSDGRKLCYAEYGDRGGKPIIIFHGNPNSRLLYGLMPDCPFRPDLYLIAPDRPGYGFSDFYPPGHSIGDYPEDIAALAEAVRLIRQQLDEGEDFGPDRVSEEVVANAPQQALVSLYRKFGN